MCQPCMVAPQYYANRQLASHHIDIVSQMLRMGHHPPHSQPLMVPIGRIAMILHQSYVIQFTSIQIDTTRLVAQIESKWLLSLQLISS